MLTTLAAGRVFDFSHAVGRGGSGMGFSRAVALALGEGDTVYVLNRGAEQIKDVPWNRAYVGAPWGSSPLDQCRAMRSLWPIFPALAMALAIHLARWPGA